MAIEIILLADVKDLGAEGAVVKVADGYARNYLIPKKLGALVTDATRRRLAKLQKERMAARDASLAAAQAMAAEVAKGSYTIRAKVSEGEQLFGSVTNIEIAKLLQSAGFAIEKHQVLLDEHIKKLGVYEVKVKIHHDVEATIKVWVVEE